MKMTAHKIEPCLWFDTEAEEAANFYVSIFENARIGRIARYGKEGHAKAGSVLTVEFSIGEVAFIALNAGPDFKFNEAVSFYVHCETQQEIDYFWSKLSKGGEEGQCGWLKDKFGLSWQIIPAVIPDMLTDPDTKRSERVLKAVMQMKKLDLAELKRAYDGRK